MTEPSREAVDAMATRMRELDPGFNPEYDAAKDLIHELLEAALPIELEKARQRWEQEVRERLETKAKALNTRAEARFEDGDQELWHKVVEEREQISSELDNTTRSMAAWRETCKRLESQLDAIQEYSDELNELSSDYRWRHDFRIAWAGVVRRLSGILGGRDDDAKI